MFFTGISVAVAPRSILMRPASVCFSPPHGVAQPFIDNPATIIKQEKPRPDNNGFISFLFKLTSYLALLINSTAIIQ